MQLDPVAARALMALTLAQHTAFAEQGFVVFDTHLPPILLDKVEAVLDNHCPHPPDGAESFRPVISAAANKLQPPLVDTISHTTFEEVARELLRADRVRLEPGYKGQCVYPEHAL